MNHKFFGGALIILAALMLVQFGMVVTSTPSQLASDYGFILEAVGINPNQFFGVGENVLVLQNPTIKQATLIIDFGDKKREFVSSINQTLGLADVLSALPDAQTLAQNNPIDIKTSSDGIIESVEGYKNGDDGKIWHMILNSKEVDSVLGLNIKAGDKLELIFN